MKHIHLTEKHIQSFIHYLNSEEKSRATVEKYERDARTFLKFIQNQEITKEITIAYKTYLMNHGYHVRSINSMIAAVNNLLQYLGLDHCKIKTIREQRKTYCTEDKMLTYDEYLRLLDASKTNQKFNLLLQTICGTGIRVSELVHFTVEAVRTGEIVIHCKNKTRTILLPRKLAKYLLKFARKNGIHSGPIFVTRTGKPLNRSNIWKQMKKICKLAGVKASKVFPHNLRKLFARKFYRMDKDIAKLADILGHSSINTTRIYIMTTGLEHRKKIELLGLVL